MKTSPLLSTFNFTSLGTTRITNAAWDILERSFYAVLAFPPSPASGREKMGKVVKVDLYRQVRENEQIKQGEDEDDEENSSNKVTVDESDARWKALGGGGRGDIAQVSEEDSNTLGRFFSTSNDYVSSIYVSGLSSHLIVGTQSGKLHILSLPSLQNIRTIVPSQTSSISSLAAPITYIQSMIRPIDLISRTGTSSSSMSGNKTNEAEIMPRPIASQLSRTVLQPHSTEAEERVINIRLTGNGNGSPFGIDDIVLPPLNTTASSRSCRNRLFASGAGPSSTGVSSTVATGGNANLQTLQEENAKLRDQLARSIAFNDKMWESVVDGTLAKAKEEGKLAGGQAEFKVNGMQID